VTHVHFSSSKKIPQTASGSGSTTCCPICSRVGMTGPVIRPIPRARGPHAPTNVRWKRLAVCGWEHQRQRRAQRAAPYHPDSLSGVILLLHICTGAPLRFAPLHGIFVFLANRPTDQPVNTCVSLRTTCPPALMSSSCAPILNTPYSILAYRPALRPSCPLAYAPFLV
jgi:hypothetical protein